MGRADSAAPFNFADVYESFLVAPLFRPFVDDLLNDAGLGRSDDLLDVACGTGIVARTARQRLDAAARVVGVDLSPNMLAVASRVAPEIDWRQGDAASLPLQPEERFDVVVSQQGVQFFPQKAEAVAAMRDALRPGGRVAVATWRPLDEIPFARALHEVAERHLGPTRDLRHSFGEGDAVAALLRDGGFLDVGVRTVTRRIRFEDGGQFVRLNTMALIGMNPRGKAMSDEDRAAAVAAIVADSGSILTQYADGAALAYEIGTIVARGRRSS